MTEHPTSPIGTADLGELVSAIRAMPSAADDTERIDRIRQFERLKSAIAAAQLAEAAAFDSSQRVEQAKVGMPPSRQGRGIAAQVALAMHVSPWYAARWLGWAKVLTRELPVTFGELRAGRTNETRALIMARETVWLSREDRAEVDAALGPQLEQLSDRRIEGEAKKHAYRLDPAGVVARRRVALGERRVTLRPLPDTMTALTGISSVERGVAMLAALRRAADTTIATGQAEGRSHSQIMSDTLVERVTGQSDADGVPLTVNVVIPVDTLLNPNTGDTGHEDVSDGHADGHLQTGFETGPAPAVRDEPGGDEPALLTAGGLIPFPIPGVLARELIATTAQGWIRRLFTAPATGRLVAMETTARRFTAGQCDFLRHRDQYCSTPYCGAPIRHADHATPVERGGATSITNGNGKCAACNWAKQAPGWRQTMTIDGRGTVTTPTGHTYDLEPPPLTPPRPNQPDPVRRPPDESPLVIHFQKAFDLAG